MNLTERFKEGLKKYNLTQEEIIKSGYTYAGGKIYNHKLRILQYNKYFLLSGIDAPEDKKKCICDHKILNLFYIHSKSDDRTLILGSCCIKKFIPKKNRGKTCSDCGEPHKNIKVNKCNDCRPKKNKGKICSGCGEPHRNRKVDKCNDCREWICSVCGDTCGWGYYKCYNC